MKKIFLNVFLHQGEEKINVGELAQVKQDIYFEYSANFIARQIEISPFKLPLKAGVYRDESRTFQGLPGVFYDSLPDGWGLLLMDRYFRRQGMDPGTISPLERLAYLGDRAMGALSYEPAIPIKIEKLKSATSLALLASECEQILQGHEDDILPELIIAGGSSGGARPKVLIGYNAENQQICTGMPILPTGFQHYLVKFSSMIDISNSAEIEYAYSLMAKACHIQMADTRLFNIEKFGRAFATTRFDRDKNQRIHMHSLSGLLHADFRIPNLDYTDFLKATWLITQDFLMVIEGFRRMVFNVFMHNRDDHSKNFSFLLLNQGWQLSPAYDLTFSAGIAGEHTMTIAGEGANPTRKHLLKVANQLEIDNNSAIEIIEHIAFIRSQWMEFSQQAHVSKRSALHLNRIFSSINN
jgi:serine/threonine-protein kinase HipA